MYIVTITQNNLSLGVNLKPKKTHNTTTTKLKRGSFDLISHNRCEYANHSKHKFATLDLAKKFASKFANNSRVLVSIRQGGRNRHK